METIKLIILLGYVIAALVVFSFNWLYSARTIRANKHIGLYTPKYIRRLVKISNTFALLTALIALIAVLFRLY